MIRAVRLMFVEIFRFFLILGLLMVGFVIGLWLIAAANECNAPGAMDEDDDCDLDSEVDSLKHTIRYMFQVFIGTGDLGGVVEQDIAILFMCGVTVFGTLSSTIY